MRKIVEKIYRKRVKKEQMKLREPLKGRLWEIGRPRLDEKMCEI